MVAMKPFRLCIAVFSFFVCASAFAQFATIAFHAVTQVNVTEAHFGKGADIGRTHLAGVPVVNFTPQQATVTIPLQIDVNQDRYEQFTIADPPRCNGVRLRLYRTFIESHEQTHTRQIANEVESTLAGSTMYDPQSQRFKFKGKVATKQQLETDVVNEVRRIVNALAAEDVRDYAQHAESGHFGGLELEARSASCDEFMSDYGNGFLRIVSDGESAAAALKRQVASAAQTVTVANASAGTALQAANAMEAAARACDENAFRDAFDAFGRSFAAAERDRANAEAAVRAVLATVDTPAPDLYAMAKAVIPVEKFPRGDDRWAAVVRERQALRQQAHALTTTKAEQTLANAKSIADQAISEFASCPNITQSPCPGQERSVMGVYKKCEKDGYWHEIPFERWECPGGIVVAEALLDDLKTDEPCFLCPDMTSILGYKRVCRNGYWHEVEFERWVCRDGSVYAETELSDRATDQPCSGGRVARTGQTARERSQNGRTLAPTRAKLPARSRKPAKPLPIDWHELEKLGAPVKPQGP